ILHISGLISLLNKFNPRRGLGVGAVGAVVGICYFFCATLVSLITLQHKKLLVNFLVVSLTYRDEHLGASQAT
ncbi:MAG: hypothetical protein ACPGWR_04880, partial [Ardenticatenaceae bacterium]